MNLTSTNFECTGKNDLLALQSYRKDTFWRKTDLSLILNSNVGFKGTDFPGFCFMIFCYENVDSKGDKMRYNKAPLGGSFCKERLNRLVLVDPQMMPPDSMPPEKLTSTLDDIATLFQFLLSCP